MADVLFVVIVIGLFAMCGGLVSACDRLLAGDEQATAEPQADEPVGALTGSVAP